MTKEELIEQLNSLEDQHRYQIMGQQGVDTERVHVAADELLLDYINDTEIREAFEALRKWYA
jgi:hypothetical protein